MYKHTILLTTKTLTIMRKRFLLSLLVALLTTLSTHAYDFQSGDLYYYITSDTTVEVTYQYESWSESNYQGLTTATIPETVTNNGSTYSVTSIGMEAFYNCSSLTSITIPNSVTSIGYRAFYGCSSLPVEDNLRYADTYLVEAVDKSLSTYTIKAGTKWIGNDAFSRCSSLTSITIPNSVTSIGDIAFSRCSSLTSITIPNSVTSIGDEAFYGCSSLTSITIPNSVTSIGDYAFYDCSSLTSLTLPNSVTSIGDDAFAWCTSLTSIVVESGNTMYDSRENCNAIIETASNTLIAGCQSTTIPNSVTSIGDYAFRDCSSLTSITLPNSVTSIGCYAFGNCSSLADIYCYATTPPVCYVSSGYESFLGVSRHCYIHVPAGTIRDYQMAAGWSDFYHFFEISELPDGAPTDQVGVTVTGNYATFSWPVNPTASSYTLTITKDGEVFCTLIFNNMGQLVGMAFAPARNGEQSANQDDAQSTAYGFSFVVTNLDANSHYTYTFTVNGADNEVIETYSGSFDTSEVTALSETERQNKPSRKIIRDGQVLILRNGETYDMMGQRL